MKSGIEVRKVLPALAVLTLPLTAAFGGVDAPSEEIPFELIGDHLIVVPVTIGDQENLRFVLDTGASHTYLSNTLVRRLRLPSSGRAQTVLALGRSVRVAPIRVPSLTLAGIEFKDVEARVTNKLPVNGLRSGRGIDGLIGLSLLRRLSVSIDYPSQTLRFGRLAEDIPFQPVYNGLPVILVNVQVDGRPLRLLLDTGASELILYRRRVGQRLKLNYTGRRKEILFGGGRTVLEEIRLKEFSLGEARWMELQAYTVYGPSLNEGVDGVLGVSGLGLARLHLDLAGGRVGWEK